MNDFYRYSRITGKSYNVFNTIRILNLKQSMAYISNGVMPVDLKIEKNDECEHPRLVFYFIKDETIEVYNKWCNHELEITHEDMWN